MILLIITFIHGHPQHCHHSEPYNDVGDVGDVDADADADADGSVAC